MAPLPGGRLLGLHHLQPHVPPAGLCAAEDGGLLEEYRFLTEHVTMWDVAVERQIQVKGPDAAAFVDLLITRDVHALLPPMQARYVILCNQHGGLINDPVLLRVAEDEFWFSISDSDLLLWAQGVNSSGRFDVDIREIDVAPVQIQGPKSVLLMEKIFGPHVREIPYYHLTRGRLNGPSGHHLPHRVLRRGGVRDLPPTTPPSTPMTSGRTSWSRGRSSTCGSSPPAHIRRLEAGILSYGQDMDIENNPYEVRLGWQVDLTKETFIGKEALARIKSEGVRRRLVGLRVGGEPILWYNEDFYLVKDSDAGADVGYVTSAFWSPNVGSNIALAILPPSHWKRGTRVQVQLPEDGLVDAQVVRVPFFDPSKERPKSQL